MLNREPYFTYFPKALIGVEAVQQVGALAKKLGGNKVLTPINMGAKYNPIVADLA